MVITPDYDIALSFAGEDRKHADALNRALTGRGGRIFYDADVEHDLWGRNRYDYLDEVYRKRARYCIVFASAAYAQKMWTSPERRSAQARSLQENEAYTGTPISRAGRSVAFGQLMEKRSGSSSTDVQSTMEE